MEMIRRHHIVDKDGELVVRKLPYKKGQSVELILWACVDTSDSSTQAEAKVKMLERQIERLEKEVASLQQVDKNPSALETPAERGGRLLREAKASQVEIAVAVAKAFAEMGISGQPVGTEKLRKMMLECGIKPEENVFSQEIIRMREESGK